MLALIDETLPADMVLVFDDAERAGEQDTVAAAHRALGRLGRDYQVGVVRAAKTQVAFATGRFAGVAYL